MGIYGGGTFRVKGQSFNFKATYPHAVDMWDNRIDWGGLKARFSARHGSSEGAVAIERGLQYLDIPVKDRDKLMDEEVDMISEILADTGGGYSLLGFSSKLNATQRGEQFERRIAKLVSKVFEDTTEEQAYAGQRLARAPVTETIYVDTSGLKSNYKQRDLWNIVKEQLGVEYKGLVESLALEIEGEFGSTDTPVIMRGTERFGKIDIDASSSMKINSQLSPAIQAMAEAMRGCTFSLKNYQSSTLKSWGGVSLGHAADFRAYSSFYFAASGDNNFANTCTFIFSSLNSKGKTVERYLSWARFLYELTGIGLFDITSQSTGEVVDYLIINVAGARSYGRVSVLWVGDLINNMPKGDPPYGQVTDRRGHTHFVFSTSV